MGAKRIGVDAARETRALLARLIADSAAESEGLDEALAPTVGLLFCAEIMEGSELAATLAEALRDLHALLASDRWGSDRHISRRLSRACALLHPAHQEVERRTGAIESDDMTPFILTPARVRSVPAPALERRDEVRAEVETDVGLEGDTRFFTGKTGDISSGGLFVATDAPLSRGTIVGVSFVLPGGYRVRAEAHVAWVRSSDPGSAEAGGMGLHFQTLRSDDRAAIEHFLQYRPAFVHEA